MKISVVIPAFNEEKFLFACLKSVVAQSEKPLEIIVVNNNSTDKTLQIAKSFPQVTIMSENKQGITPTRNLGFNAAQGDIIARTDADTKVQKSWLKKIKKRFESDPELIALSGPARFEGIPKAVQPNNWMTVIGFNATFRQAVHHDVLFGPNMSIRKSIWEKAKLEVCMDDKKVHEDMDLALHIAKYGKILFDEKLVVVSSPRRWKKLLPYVEYPYRFLRTVQHHNLMLSKSRNFARNVFPRTKRLIKRLASAAAEM